MSVETFKQAGIRFDYCRAAVVPEVPYVQDVLYALRLSEEQKNYDFCRSNHELYNANVHTVAAAVGFEIMSMRPYDEAKARQIIAKAIIELCPDEARCLFNNAYYEAVKLIGEEVPPKSADAETIQWVCSCPHCKEALSRGGECDATHI